MRKSSSRAGRAVKGRLSWAIGLALLFLMPHGIYAQERVYLSGTLVEQPTYYFLKNDDLLNPQKGVLDFPDWQNRGYGLIQMNYNDSNIKWRSQFRPVISSNHDTTKIKAIVDEAFLDIGLSENAFLYFGKKNIRDGVGFGANPTDFLGEDKTVDPTKSEEQRRIEREGNILIGFDFYANNKTWTILRAPEMTRLQNEDSRFLMKMGTLIEPLNADLALTFFDGPIPGVGMNLSTTLGDDWVLYTESAARRGSDKKVVQLVSPGIPRLYQIAELTDQDTVYPHIATGGHYTSKDGTNIILEYIYNGDGYNDREWDDLVGFVRYSHDEFTRGFLPDLMRSNLLQANQIMTFRQMRKNYLFTRVSRLDMWGKIDGALVLLWNLDDQSRLFYPSLDYKVTGDTTVGLTALLFDGKADAEFGLTHWDAEISLIGRRSF